MRYCDDCAIKLSWPKGEPLQRPEMRELQALVDELRHRFNTDRVTFDMPNHMKAFFGR